MRSNHMKISEFAQVTGITRKNLIFYDKIGLLSPTRIDGQNNYRYYTYQQIDTANVITVLREINMSLKEIKAYLCGRSPEKMICMLNRQKKIVQEKIKMLIQISDMLDTRIDLTQQGIDVELNMDSIILKECEETPILLGPELPADANNHLPKGWYYLLDFYEFCRKNKVIRGLPTGIIISHADLVKGIYVHPSHYYYRPVSGSSYPNNAQKPRGLYVIGQEQAEYGMNSHLYNRLFTYIEEAGLKICGNAYEEYLFDEISTVDSEQYLLQIAIHVQK